MLGPVVYPSRFTNIGRWPTPNIEPVLHSKMNVIVVVSYDPSPFGQPFILFRGEERKKLIHGAKDNKQVQVWRKN
jgi:hypothetical protein